MVRLPTFFLLCVLVAFFGFPMQGFADGKFFSSSFEKAYPTIQRQGAIINYRGGVQKLTLSSKVEGADSTLAWIIPMPTAEVTFEAAPAEQIKQFLEVAKPQIVHIKTKNVPIFFYVFCFGWFFMWAVEQLLFGRHRLTLLAVTALPNLLSLFLIAAATIWPFLLYLLFMVPSFFVLSSAKRDSRITAVWSLMYCAVALSPFIFINSLGTRGIGGDESSMPSVLQRSIVGAYDMVLLKAESADELDAWLLQEGFEALDSSAKDVVSEYIKDGWFFVCSKLDSGRNEFEQHPVTFVFDTDKPVYPMRLTGVNSHPLHLELILLSDRGYQVPGLNREFSMKVQKNNNSEYTLNGRNADRVLNFNLGSEVWDNVYLAKYSGTLTHEQMTRDFFLEPALHMIPWGKKTYTPEKIKEMQLMLIGVIWTVAVPLWIILRYNSIQNCPNRKKKVMALVIAILQTIVIVWIFGQVVPEYPYPVILTH